MLSLNSVQDCLHATMILALLSDGSGSCKTQAGSYACASSLSVAWLLWAHSCSLQIDAVIAYMDELGVKDKDLASAIKQFPQLLGMKVEERMKPNITKIEHEFKIKGPAMNNVLKRKPQVLGFNWDCYGDCQGNCPRCWVHF